MTCPFRYVAKTSNASVTLHLFKTMNGTPRGDVRGPSSRNPGGRSDVCDMEACLPVALAFAAAVRMANRHDVELVVSGDREMWDVSWGRLTGPMVVLVVEDEALVRMGIAGLMEEDGFVVLEAGNFPRSASHTDRQSRNPHDVHRCRHASRYGRPGAGGGRPGPMATGPDHRHFRAPYGRTRRHAGRQHVLQQALPARGCSSLHAVARTLTK